MTERIIFLSGSLVEIFDQLTTPASDLAIVQQAYSIWCDKTDGLDSLGGMCVYRNQPA